MFMFLFLVYSEVYIDSLCRLMKQEYMEQGVESGGGGMEEEWKGGFGIGVDLINVLYVCMKF